MCGICGFYSSNRAIVPEHLENVARSLEHRGPDGLGTWVHPRSVAGLGHARLAIIDLECGQQPMCAEDGRFIIVFNGEIYNYRELRSELLALGHGFRTRSDTEVLLNAYRQWGEGSLIRLDGMFAFAIFDTENQKLFLARDRTGIKPLYYHRGTHGLVFGSEIKALLAWPHVPRRADFPALADFLMLGYPLLPATCFRDCRELEPGSFLEVSENNQRLGRYWNWSRSKGPRNGSNPLESLEGELKTAVIEHLVSDVPVGAFLSGGIDSSLLVALAAAHGGPKIQTFNVKFGEAAYDESVYARAVAAHVGTEHHELAVETSGGDLATVEVVLDQFDQPFGDSSAIPTYLICREIRKHVKVVIGGDGGDEMFGGYPRFRHADTIRLLGHAPEWLLSAAEGPLRSMRIFPPDTRRQGLRLLRAAKQTGQQRLLEVCSILRSEELLHAIQPEFAEALGPYRPGFPAVHNSGSSGGGELIDITVRTALPGDYLRKVDVMSSAHGLEVRVPMLANRILELAAKLPQHQKYSCQDNKILLRQLAKKFLPVKVVTKRKQGFGIPLDSWLGVAGRSAISAALSSKCARLRDLIRPTYIEELMTPFASQSWDHTKLSRYSLYQRFYALWGLERWLLRWRPTL
jgi:asparagine synthase (glutamine-hydrolysing)